LKVIGKEDARYCKPFFDLKDTVDWKMKFLDPSASCVDHSTFVLFVFN